jgi:hypothetical protein
MLWKYDARDTKTVCDDYAEGHWAGLQGILFMKVVFREVVCIEVSFCCLSVRLVFVKLSQIQ